MKSPLLNYAVIALLLFLGFTEAGCKKSSTTTIVPEVQTFNIISDVTPTTAACGGITTNFSVLSLTANGVCWSSTNTTPTISDSRTKDVLTAAIFNSSITGLTPNTTYYVRAYATASTGTSYGSVLTFTTPSSDVASTVTVSTFAGSGSAGFTNGSGTSAQFNNPQGIVADASGNIYVADGGNNVIRKITSGGVVTTFAGNGTAGFTDGTSTAAEFYNPAGLAVDANNNIYVADLGNHSIRMVTQAGVVTTIAGDGIAGYLDSVGVHSRFRLPTGLVVKSDGIIFVADKGNHDIRRIAAGVHHRVSTLAGVPRVAGYLDADVSTSALFSSPTGVALDPSSGDLFITDLGNNAIRRFHHDTGVVTTFAGGGYNKTVIGLPTGICMDASKNKFITDEAGRILEITSGKVLYVLAGSSSAGFVNGTGSAALFNIPLTSAVDASGNIYVADENNQVIRKITINK